MRTTLVRLFVLFVMIGWINRPFLADGFLCESVNDLPLEECIALTTLYSTLNGSQWVDQEGWLDNKFACDWHGVTCEGGHIVELVLNSNQLEGSIPAEIGNLAYLRLLDLNHNKIDALPPTIGRLSHLESIQLLDNNLSQLPSELAQLTALGNLNLFGNKLTTLPDLSPLTNLFILSVGANLLTTLPDSLWELQNLSTLDVSKNQLTTIPDGIGRLHQLRELLLTQNPLQTIPQTLSQLTQLNSLLLGWTTITELPEGIFPNLTQLSILTLNYTELTTLPSDLAGASSLQQLYLNGSTLEGDWLTPLTSLTMLQKIYYDNTNICNPETTSVANWLGTIPTVQSSGFTCNNTVDPTIFCATQQSILQHGCEALSDLYLATDGINWSNDIGWFRDQDVCHWYGIACRGKSVFEIALPNNHLQGAIPDSIADFSVLERLDFSNNQLQSVPAALFKNHNLTALNLAHNLLETIEPKIIELWALQSLDLSNNQLKSIPAEIGGLSFLTHLDVSNNSSLLGEIPRSFINLRLQTFSYQTTLLCTSGDEIFSRWMDGIETIRPNNEGHCQQPPPPFCANVTGIDSAECGALFALYNHTQGLNWRTVWDKAWFVSYTPCTWSGVRCEDGHIVELSLDNRALQGELPPEIEALQWLENLNLDNNGITTVPNGLGRLPALRVLSLQNNQLDQLPDLSALKNLETLQLSKNNLTGPYPTHWAELPALTTLTSVETSLCIPFSSFGRWLDQLQFTGSENWCPQSIFLPIIER